MTCIVGVVFGSNVWIGGDSYSEINNLGSCRATPKVFGNGEILIGFSGEARVGQVLRYAELPQPESATDIDRFVCVDLCNAIREVITQAGCLKMEDNQQQMEATLLVGIRGHLYSICGGFCATENMHGYDAIDSGNEVAAGALFANSHKPTQERICEALAAAQRHGAYVREPFHVELI